MIPEKLTEEEIFDRLKRWQADKLKLKIVLDGKETLIPYYVHPLTCEKCGTNLNPEMLENKAVLVCPRCNMIQTLIPLAILADCPELREVLWDNK